jgi:hypothetical protein
MYTIKFYNYTYDGDIGMSLDAVRVFNSFVNMIEFLRDYSLFRLSDEQTIMCGNRHLVKLPGHLTL